jgi:5-methylcytosine-specific restriction endonuclease McrA
MPSIRCWCESIWGKKSPYVQFAAVDHSPTTVSKEIRKKPRMPLQAVKNALIERDGHHCRFCGIPVIRSEVRRRVTDAYPKLNIWGVGNINQHAAFQTMWAQYDHVIPYTRGGSNEIDNLVVTCAPCNFGRMQYTLEEVGLVDPRTRAPVRSTWDGLERFC